ncbi:MAG: hypothetical protein ACRCYY_18600 [Trueperaceae bacterium]
MDYGLEQIFLRLRGGLMEVLLVLEDISGARTRETLKFSTRNGVETVRRLAKHLANRGDVDALKKLRLRVEERGELKDDEALRRLFLSEFRHQTKNGM